jgi:hypothetical protein
MSDQGENVLATDKHSSLFVLTIDHVVKIFVTVTPVRPQAEPETPTQYVLYRPHASWGVHFCSKNFCSKKLLFKKLVFKKTFGRKTFVLKITCLKNFRTFVRVITYFMKGLLNLKDQYCY